MVPVTQIGDTESGVMVCPAVSLGPETEDAAEKRTDEPKHGS